MIGFITEAGRFEIFYNEENDKYEVHNLIGETSSITFDTLQDAEDYADKATESLIQEEEWYAIPM